MNKKVIIGIILCSAFFDYRINDLQEPKRALRSSNRSATMGSFVCGLVLAALALFF